MQFLPLPPLLGLLTPLEPLDAGGEGAIEPGLLDIVIDLDVPAAGVWDGTALPFDRLLADQEALPPVAPKLDDEAVFVPASVEALLREAHAFPAQATGEVTGQPASPQADGYPAAPPAMDAWTVTPDRPDEPAPTWPSTGSASADASATKPPSTTASTNPAAPPTVLASMRQAGPVATVPGRSALELLRSPELQAPPTLSYTEPAAQEAAPAPTPDTVPPAVVDAAPARPRPREAPRSTQATVTAATVEVDAPDTTPAAPSAKAPPTTAPTTAPADVDIPDLPAPVPQRVHLKVGDDLDVDISRDGDGIGVILEGTAAAVDPLRQVGSELADELARAGMDLTDFNARERGEQDRREPKRTGAGTPTGPAQTDDAPTANHDGLIDLVA